MFGYVKAYKPELKCRDYDIYQGVYCSLCRQLGHDYGVLARMMLNYDFTLLALVRLSVTEECCGFEEGHCSFNPAKKCMKCVNGQTHLSFAAAAAILMCYYKVLDNLQDEKNPFRRFLFRLVKPYFAVKRRKAKRKFPQIDLILSEAMAQQKQAELSAAGVDASAHPSALAMSRLLALDMPQEKQACLSRFGYLVGRWVYLADALDDCKKDLASGSYNVFNRKFEKEDEKKEYAAQVIRLTAAELGKCFETLAPKRFGAILENILQFGTEETLKKVLKEEMNEKPVRCPRA